MGHPATVPVPHSHAATSCTTAELSCAHRCCGGQQSWVAKLPLEVQQVLLHQHPATPGGVGRAACAVALPLAAAPRTCVGAWGAAAARLQGLLLEELTAFPTLFSKHWH